MRRLSCRAVFIPSSRRQQMEEPLLLPYCSPNQTSQLNNLAKDVILGQEEKATHFFHSCPKSCRQELYKMTTTTSLTLAETAKQGLREKFGGNQESNGTKKANYEG